MQVVRRMPMVLERAQGTYVYDTEGNAYLDFTAGWAVLNLGHAHPEVTAAIQEQAGMILQMSNLFYTIPQLKLAKILIDHSCMDRVFFCNSGAEANEGVSKLARKYGKLKRNGAYEIITANNSFHGRTMGMMAATGQAHYQDNWRPLMPGFVNVDFNDIEAIKTATNENTCAVMLEPVQGEGGVNVPDADYFPQVRSWCDQHNLLLIVDEVQTGMGRLGTLFGYQQFGFEPDAMTLAKALGSGAPLGAFLCKQSCAVLEPGDHGSTFGGNALTTVAGAAGAKVLVEENWPQKGGETGAYLKGKLEGLKDKHGFIQEVRGMGMLLAIQMTDDRAAAVITETVANGLLLNAVRPNMIRFMPPLTTSREEVDKAMEILDAALAKTPPP
ncbi:MAG: aspartate aminotransferase family protein [bacterium]|nr:aspartate aminotransferase family protein [bacterium]